MTPRLTARFWVDAWLARARLMALPAYVIAHGDDTAGAILVKCATLDGAARAWTRIAGQWAPLISGTEPEVDAAIARERARDPDLWVLEIEDRLGRGLLD